MNFGFFVPGPARAKQSFRVGARGRGHQTARVKGWQSDVGWAAQEAIRQIGGQFPLTEKLDVSLVFCLSDRRRIDIDNLSKAVLDGMNRIVFEDDQQVMVLHVRKALASMQAGVLVRIRSLDPNELADDPALGDPDCIWIGGTIKFGGEQ